MFDENGEGLLLGERRRTDRVRVSLDANWEGTTAQCSGLVVDLSTYGCFVLTSDRVQPRELVRLEIEAGERVDLWGEVVYRVPEMGFALSFVEHGGRERRSLEQLIEQQRVAQCSPAFAASR